MNVYDFDGTIYAGDSTVDFFLYALKKKPLLVRYAPKMALGFVLYTLKRIDKTRLKEYFFCFLSGFDAEKLLPDFWQRNENKIYPWYLKQKRPDDIIISASPEFLLAPICKKLGTGRLIASRVDVRSGSFLGENCRGEEKVRRLSAECGALGIDCFYSDTQSDLPLARLANKAFLIRKGQVSQWNIAEK